ncbi:beta-ketoacyl-[acyl-carrier-protein] synthase family protein [Dissulfurispira sp.]|uniref:beta-ketoacyl-[acyl-carrier-protein] synthase family protein n=1 Tax=Dissulfurispira sp. TaxID=2817609 RepID=UPI002FD8EC3C
MRRIMITGIGAVTPLANNFFDSWSLVKKGISGISRISKFDTTGLSWTMAGEVKGFNPELYLSKKEILKLDPFLHYAVAAATMAAEDAGLLKSKIRNSKFEFDNAGVIIGSSRGGITTIEKELSKLLTPNSKLSSYLMPSTTISMAASYVAQKLGTKGHCLGISNACASGTNAIGEAYRLIKHGYADIVIAGGTEAPICRFCVEGYGISGALSKTDNPSASRPFDTKRDGFVLAEGACILVLEEYASAIKRNTEIYGEIIGYSSTTDAYHITRPDIEGEIRAIHSSLEDAGVSPEDVDYINAHGTSTPIGDMVEANAIKNIFRSNIPAPVTSIKSMTGHMLAASGSFEVACTAMSIKEEIIPPTINITQKDHECNINVITEKKEADIKIAITNSFGFGGVNAVIVLKKVDE